MLRLQTLIYLMLMTAVLFVFFVPVNASAANPAVGPIQHGACDASGGVNCTDQQAADSVNHTVANIINILSIVAGIVAVIMIILAGFRYITSSGAAEKVAGAKSTLLYAVVGLIIVALAQVIARFVLHTATK